MEVWIEDVLIPKEELFGNKYEDFIRSEIYQYCKCYSFLLDIYEREELYNEVVVRMLRTCPDSIERKQVFAYLKNFVSAKMGELVSYCTAQKRSLTVTYHLEDLGSANKTIDGTETSFSNIFLQTEEDPESILIAKDLLNQLFDSLEPLGKRLLKELIDPSVELCALAEGRRSGGGHGGVLKSGNNFVQVNAHLYADYLDTSPWIIWRHLKIIEEKFKELRGEMA